MNSVSDQTATYYRPTTLSQCLELLEAKSLTIVAGATDLFPAKTARNAWGDWRQSALLDIGELKELHGITETSNQYRIGAMTTWSDLIQATLPPCFNALKEAALQVGSIQIQNRATIAGNICNASPAADGVPALLCLDAEVELCSQSGKRIVPLDEFIRGNRDTTIQPSELMTALVIPKLPETTDGGYYKLGARRYLVISTVNVAIVLNCDANDCLDDIRIAVGACSAVAQRLRDLEDKLRGQLASADLVDQITMDHFEILTPISDIRADANYRLQTALEITRRLFTRLTQ
ncbi:MAG: xanthine dehydrogenase family protein subunit M [Gammaproteobacteria bacterium]|nr:xanthine dehydrogenase family protein subunit M [Gammaproteobacteria bacterium]